MDIAWPTACKRICTPSFLTEYYWKLREEQLLLAKLQWTIWRNRAVSKETSGFVSDFYDYESWTMKVKDK